MNNNKNKSKKQFWEENRPYYILYQDKMFIKDISAQLFDVFNDVGEIAYIGATTHKVAKDYSLDGEQANALDRKSNCKTEDVERYNKNDIRKRARINICDTNEESQIREYANIKEIKEMNNMLFYKNLIKKLVYEYQNGKYNNLCYIKDRVQMYETYKDSQDVFVKMKDSCIWLKKDYMDTTAFNLANVMGTVNMIGYILEEASENSPQVVKALAIYT